MKASRIALLLAAGAVTLALSADAEAAQSPFGIATPDSPSGAGFGGPLGPVFQWIALRQAEFYRSLTGTLTRIKADGTAAWLLVALSFAYGVFHAAGPGHGKAVISSYLVASGETVRRGVAISFVAAFAQAVTAVVFVSLAALVFRATALAMTTATEWLEIGSYAAIAVLGAWLVWSKSFGGGHHHHGGAGDAAHDGRDHHDHGHDDHHGQCHDHAHRPTLSGRSGNPLLKAWSTILAIGIRPCSGAIIVLVFALSQGLFAIGVVSTFVMALGTGVTVAALATVAVSAKGLALRFAGAESRFAGGLLRTVEIGGGAVVLDVGLLLLGGALQGRLPG